MEKILVSACLLGDKCKYNGKDNYLKKIEELKQYYDIVPICPEVMGGLTTPRDPSEIFKDKVISSKGKNVTKQFNEGANLSVNIAKYLHIKKALLKENSPSCGKNNVYDGSFKGKLVNGEGITTKALKNLEITIYNEEEIDILIEEKKK